MRAIDADALMSKVESDIDLSITGKENVIAVCMALQKILNEIKDAPTIELKEREQ